MSIRIPRVPIPRQVGSAAMFAGLVSALAMAGLAGPAQGAGDTALATGFNEASIQEFILENPDEDESKLALAAEDRQRIVQLALTAVAFRQAMAETGPSEAGAVRENDLALFATALELAPEGPLAALWRSFFQGTIVSMGHGLAPVKRVGFYNPLVDGWLMTDWSETDEGLTLTEVHSVTGGVLRGEPVTGLDLPAWTRMDDKSVLGAVALAHDQAAQAFWSIHPLTAQRPAPVPTFDTHAQRQIIESRLGAVRRSLNALGRPAFESATREFLDSLYSGDPMRLANLVEGGSTASVHWVNGLLTPLRLQFRPTGVFHHPGGVTVAYGVPDNGRWLLFARYRPEEADALVLNSVDFIDLVTAEKGRAEP